MSLPVRLAAVAAAVAAVLVVALAPLGRWERGRADDEQLAGIARLRAEVGYSLDSPTLAAYRLTRRLDCLLYERGGNPYALELCFDRDGRLIEALDRRRGEARVWSLRQDPTRATLRADVAELFRILRRAGAIPASERFAGVLPLEADLPTTPLAPGDTGPILVGRTPKGEEAGWTPGRS